MLVKQKKAIISFFNKTVAIFKRSLEEQPSKDVRKALFEKGIKNYGIYPYHDKFCVVTPYWLIVVPEDIPEIMRCENNTLLAIEHGIELADNHRGELIGYNPDFTVQMDIDKATQWSKETAAAYWLNNDVCVNPIYWISLLKAFPDAYYYYPDSSNRPISFEDTKSGAYGLLMPCMSPPEKKRKQKQSKG